MATLDVLAVLKKVRENQRKRGHLPRTREEIDTAINSSREADEERLKDFEHLHE